MIGRLEGRSLQLYFIDGKPDGMLTAEVFNWTGHVLVTPRIQLGSALARKEASHTGVYILLGENNGGPLAYIGQARNISQRIKSHDTQKEWWTSAALITSTANNLHGAHVDYLEARLIQLARSVGRVALENGNSPTLPQLSEADQSNMEIFLDYVLMVLPALRIDMLLENTRPNPSATTLQVEGTRFQLESRLGLRAKARLEDGEFVVEAGSLARAQWEGAGGEDAGYGRLYSQLVRTGVLVPEGDHRVFTQNYAFSSPSAAAGVVYGRQANGTTEWKLVGTGQTYKQWEAAQLGGSEEMAFEPSS